MKIAQIGTINLPIPTAYGGAERVISDLSQELIKRKHEVTVFCSSDSKIANKKSFIPEHIVGDYMTDAKTMLLHLEHISKSFKYAEKYFDIIHCHISYLPHFFINYITKPVVITLHGTNDSEKYPERIMIMKKFDCSNLVSISYNQRKDFPGIKFIENVYNGVDINIFNDNKKKFKRKYLLWVGKFTHSKGPHTAIKIAEKTNTKLILIGPQVYKDKKYFQQEIKPHLNNKDIVYVGEKDKTELPYFYSNAIATLVPIEFEEPFGLVAIESMACGTPVIAFARGSVPEVIKDGKTGFIVNYSNKDKRGDWIIKKTGIEGMVEAVKKIYAMPEKEYQQMRLNCRKHVEEKFTIEKMVDNYEKVYQEVIEDWNKKHKK